MALIADAAVCRVDGEWQFVDDLAVKGAVASSDATRGEPATFVRTSASRGRYTVLAPETSPIAPGARVLADRCVAAAVLASVRGAVCDRCYSAPRARAGGGMCGACGVCCWCSAECAAAHESAHARVCGALRVLREVCASGQLPFELDFDAARLAVDLLSRRGGGRARAALRELETHSARVDAAAVRAAAAGGAVLARLLNESEAAGGIVGEAPRA